jgi:hypothetical protein
MADENGGSNTNQRLSDLEQMDKLLLRAQVLQADSIERHEASLKAHDKWMAEDRASLDKWKAETKERDKAIDTRIGNLVSAIGKLIQKIDEKL